MYSCVCVYPHASRIQLASISNKQTYRHSQWLIDIVFGPVKSMVETFASAKGSNMLKVNMVKLKIRQVRVMLDHVRSGHVFITRTIIHVGMDVHSKLNTRCTRMLL